MGETASPDRSRRMLICFDFEGSYGMPHKVPYDLHASARSILDVLARYQARAVFFVVGRIVEELADAGHEIGLHGYDHDDLASYDQYRLDRLGDDLARVGSLVEQIAGARPRCFRAPYLLTPEFYRPEVSALLRANGYHWVSNQEVRYPAELLRPDRFPLRAAFRPGPGMLPGLVRSRLALTLLNAGLVAREDFLGSPAGRLSWLLSGRSPFERAGLLEVPLYAPLDCDLLGLPRPTRRRTSSATPGPCSGAWPRHRVRWRWRRSTTGSSAAATGWCSWTMRWPPRATPGWMCPLPPPARTGCPPSRDWVRSRPGHRPAPPQRGEADEPASEVGGQHRAVDGDGGHHPVPLRPGSLEAAAHMLRARGDDERGRQGGTGEGPVPRPQQQPGRTGRQERAGHQVRGPHLAVGEQLPGRALAADEQPPQRRAQRLALGVLHEQPGNGGERQAVLPERVVQRDVLSLAERWVETGDAEDLPPVERVASGHGRGVTDGPGSQPESPVQVCDIVVGNGGAADRIVVAQGLPGPHQPPGRKSDVAVYGRDELAAGGRRPGAPRVAPAPVLGQVDEPDPPVGGGDLADDARGAVARAVVNDDDLVSAEAILRGDGIQGAGNVLRLVIRNNNETDESPVKHTGPPVFVPSAPTIAPRRDRPRVGHEQ